MKKTITRIISVMITVMMVMVMGTSVFADDDYSIKITKPANDQAEHLYEAYQIFSGTIDPSAPTTLTHINWGSGISERASFLEELTTSTTCTDFAGCTTAASIADVLQNGGNIEFFAQIAGKYADNPNSGTSDYIAANVREATITIPDNADGYYLIKDSSRNPGSDRIYRADSDYIVHLLTPNSNVDVIAKTDIPTLDKKIVTAAGDAVANTASIGDVVNFKVTSAVPDMTYFSRYTFKVTDQLSKGLTLTTDTSDKPVVTVTVGGAAYSSSKYEATVLDVSSTGTTVWQINLTGLYDDFKNGSISAGDDIIITYSATLNDDADRTDAGNTNKASLIYSADPRVTPDDTQDITAVTPDIITKTYTTGVKVIKLDPNGARLPVAEFQLAGTNVNRVFVEFYTYFAVDPDGSYYKLKDGRYTRTPPTAATASKYESTTVKYGLLSAHDSVLENVSNTVTCYTAPTAELVFSGLGDGTYTITETHAPAGYIASATPIEFTISSTPDLTGPNWEITVGGTPVTVTDNTILAVFEVTNAVEPSILPDTGSIGTAVFYAAGSVMILGGIALLVAKKKKESDGNR